MSAEMSTLDRHFRAEELAFVHIPLHGCLSSNHRFLLLEYFGNRPCYRR
jgi:hypothetical protein